MIERPGGLELVDVKINFNGLVYLRLEIDISHVNKRGRSDFTPHDVSEIAKALLDGQFLKLSGSKEFGDHICFYYVVKGLVANTQYKVVACVCSDQPRVIGIITLFQESK